MNIGKPCYVASILCCLLLTQSAAAQQFDNASLSGCYAFSTYGNLLGPEINVDPATGQLVPNAAKLVLHGSASVGRICYDGMVGEGTITEASITLNYAGLCAVSAAGTGTYSVLGDGTGSATVSATLPAELPGGCALLGVQPGEILTYTTSSAIESEEGCHRFIVLTGEGSVSGPGVVVAEGEACPQTPPQASQ